MSKLSIFESRWIDLVFENRNKEYGAYQLRQESTKTTITALLLATLMLASVIGVSKIVNHFFAALPELSVPLLDERVILADVTPLPIKPKEPKAAIVPPTEKPKSSEPTKQNMANMNVVDKTQATANVVENTNIATTTTTPNATGPVGVVVTDVVTPNTTTEKPIAHGNKTFGKDELDKNPEYPGGIKVFLNYVAKNFRPAEEQETTLKVIVSFVIEKDGSMSNIEVRNNPGYGMGEEAIRVLKSMKTKWEPGQKDGQKVRAFYNLPISIQI